MATRAQAVVPVASLVVLVAAAILLCCIDRGTIAVAAAPLKAELGLLLGLGESIAFPAASPNSTSATIRV